jgi:DNA-binding NarL/FixJ family response regulator
MWLAIKAALEQSGSGEFTVSKGYPSQPKSSLGEAEYGRTRQFQTVMIKPIHDGDSAALLHLRESFPDIPLVLFSMTRSSLPELAVLKGMWVNAVLEPCIEPDQLAQVIREVAMGRTISPVWPKKLEVDEAEMSPVARVFDGLTVRERQVLCLIATGARNNMIASELVMSMNTVKTHVKNILLKLNASNRTQAALLAMEFMTFEPGAPSGTTPAGNGVRSA